MFALSGPDLTQEMAGSAGFLLGGGAACAGRGLGTHAPILVGASQALGQTARAWRGADGRLVDNLGFLAGPKAWTFRS